MKIGFCFLVFLSFSVIAAGEETDTLAVRKQERSERNMMLNAESATVPREINIGLPEGGTGASVYIDGVSHANGMSRAYHHWSGGNAYEKAGSVGLVEAAIRMGEIGIVVDSRTRMGTDSLNGTITAKTSSNGLVFLDGAAGGPINRAKGWYFSTGAYLNYDPTNVNSPARKYIDRKQIYQFSLSRRRENAGINLSYRFSYCGDSDDGGYQKAPFIYKGDGSIGVLDGFRIGRDCYMPSDDSFTYMDVRTGNAVSGKMSDADRRTIHDITVSGYLNHDSGWKFKAVYHYSGAPYFSAMKININGISNGASGRFSLSSGGLYEGMVQNRLVMAERVKYSDHTILLDAEKKFRKHLLKTGFSAHAAWQNFDASSFFFAHTVEANPVRVFKDGRSTWSYNTNSQYFDAFKSGVELYAIDEWRPHNRLSLVTGIRLKPSYIVVDNATLDEETGINRRVEGFNLADPSLFRETTYRRPTLDYGVSENVRFDIAGGLSAVAEGFASMTSKTTTYFKNATVPSLSSIGNAFVRGGLQYFGNYADVTAVCSYITSWGNANIMNVTKGDVTLPYTAQYGIGTKGFTLDGNLRCNGFKFHALFTWQDPRYHNYKCRLDFGTPGNPEIVEIDYTNKIVTGVSRVMVELDPSYQFDSVRLWCSMRYFSRQYASRTNLAFFNGHFETFAGVEVKAFDKSVISVNVVNFLGQNGAKGSIDAVDTIEDESLLRNIPISGSYIRPLCVELAYMLNF